MPVTLRLVLGSVGVLAGILLLAVAVLGARSRLRRNRWVGVRTPATLRSDAAFTLANRVAATPGGAAGAVAVAGGAALLGGADGGLGWVLAAVSVVGTLVLAGIGGAVGDRAAAGLVPAPGPTCAGTCAGCDLVAGCRPAAGPADQPRHQPQEPGPPLNGPTTSAVTQPP